jgi:hypothetical protein
MVAHSEGTCCTRYCGLSAGILALLIACAPFFSQGQTYRLRVPEYKRPVKLSGDAAVIAADHLAVAMRLLKDGGPPSGLSEAEAAKWNLQDEVRGYGPSGHYSKEQYLADYRTEFIKQWRAQIEQYVEEGPKGTFRISRGSSYHSHSISNHGGSNGYWDAVLLVNELKKRTDQDQWSSSDRDASTKHPTAASDAFLWIYQAVIAGQGQFREGVPVQRQLTTDKAGKRTPRTERGSRSK